MDGGGEGGLMVQAHKLAFRIFQRLFSLSAGQETTSLSSTAVRPCENTDKKGVDAEGHSGDTNCCRLGGNNQ